MSWLARSIANSLKFNEDDEGNVNPGGKSESSRQDNSKSKDDGESPPTSPSHGVKEDLSELSRTLTRQFQGFTSFLAPPPQAEQKPDPDVAESDKIPSLGIRGDFAEIGGRFRSGITRLSKNINVSEITKMASSLLQIESDDENLNKGKKFNSREGPAVGVTEDVVAFASDIATHPETWLEFPLLLNDEDDDDFDISDEQQEHALAIERVVPSLAALRMELCPRYISDDHFWKIYFVLVHTRLCKEDALVLSTPQVMETRALLANESKKKNTVKRDESYSKEETAKSEHEELPCVPICVEISPESNITMNKDDDVREQKQTLADEDEEDVDEWLRDTETISSTVSKSIPIQNDEDVSFSDLEEEDGDGKDSRDWVQLGKSSSQSSKDADTKLSDTKESNDWLDIDDMIVS